MHKRFARGEVYLASYGSGQ